MATAFDLVVSDGTGYFLLTHEGRFEEPKIKAFVDWIQNEANVDQLAGAHKP